MAATISGSGTSTLINLTTSGNTILGDASTDTLNVGNGGLVKDASGNVGIGTSSPVAKLDVNGNIAGGSVNVFGTSTPANGINNVTTNALGFFTNSTERMRIDSSGKVLVARTSQQSGAVGLAGGVYCEALVSNYGIGSHSGIGGAYQTNAVNFQWNGSATRLWIDSSDFGSISVSSDYRIKRNIETQVQPAIQRVMQLRPVTYQMADYGNLFVANDVLREGFIAHELAEVIPSAVEGEKDAENQIQSLKLDALCSVMVKAIQEQQAIITQLQADVAALKGTA